MDIRWTRCPLTGKRVAVEVWAGPMYLLVQVPRRGSAYCGRLVLSRVGRWRLDSWPVHPAE